MSPRTGRPTTNPKKIRLEIRLTEDQDKLLNQCAEKLETTKTDVIVKGIELVNAKMEKSK